MTPDPSRLPRCRHRFAPERARLIPVDAARWAVGCVGVLFLLACTAGQASVTKPTPSGKDSSGGAARTGMAPGAGATGAATSGDRALPPFAQLESSEAQQPR